MDKAKTVKIHINDRMYEVPEGKDLLHTITSLGIDLPYFCWHPALGSVGACRQCAVIQYKDENDEKGKLVMACLVKVEDGLRCSTEAPDAVKFRAHIIEWLMVNHPHDCPVCDEGGECHLQDMTLMSGHNYRRYRFTKRTFRNQDLGPFIYHEMNRCITCYRCVRFYHDYAGGDDLQAFGSHDHVHFGRVEDGTLENEFSGNLVEVCPTGVFTDKTLRKHYTRKWDLQSGPSVCQHCGLGCNILAGERYGKLVRILNRYNHDVNGYFICDRGRFGYEHVNSDQRVLAPRAGKTSDANVSFGDALKSIKSFLTPDKRILGIGSPRASLETNAALRTLVGVENFYQGVSETGSKIVGAIIDELKSNPACPASLHDVESADAVLVLGEDLTNTAPMLALAVRQAARNKAMEGADSLNIPRWQDASVREFLQSDHGPFFQATLRQTKLDRIATAALHLAPQDIARFGFAVAHALDKQSPAVADLPDNVRKLVEQAANALKDAKHPVIIAGSSLHEQSIVAAAANCARALKRTVENTQLAFVVPDCNSIGLGMFGAPSVDEAMTRLESGEVDTAIVVENDLSRMVEKSRLAQALKKVKHLVYIDHLETPTLPYADIVLPASTFAEGDGTIINNEGRAQRYFQALRPKGDIKESWRWLADIIELRGSSEAVTYRSLDTAAAAAFELLNISGDTARIAPDSTYRIHGSKISRSPFRYSGRTAMHANISVSEPKPPEDPDSPLSFTMEGVQENQPGSLIPFFWSPGWNSVQSTQRYMKEVGAELRGGDPGLRLFDEARSTKTGYHAEIPEAFSVPKDGLLAVPVHAIFGSEELSNASAPIRERIQPAFASLNQTELKRHGCSPGENISIRVGDDTIRVVAKADDSMPDGLVGIVAGHTMLPALSLPTTVLVSRAGESE